MIRFWILDSICENLRNLRVILLYFFLPLFLFPVFCLSISFYLFPFLSVSFCVLRGENSGIGNRRRIVTYQYREMFLGAAGRRYGNAPF